MAHRDRPLWLRLTLLLAVSVAGLAGIAILVGLVVRAVVVQVSWSRLQKVEARMEAKWGSLDVASMVHPRIPEGENQAVLFRLAGRAARFSPQEKQALEGPGIKRDLPLSPSDVATLRDLVRRKAGAISTADEAARRPRANWDIDYTVADEPESPNMLELIDLARLLRGRTRLAILDDEAEDALRGFETQLALSESLAQERWAFIQMMRRFFTRLAWRSLEDLLQSGDLAAQDLARLRRAADRIPIERTAQFALVGDMKLARKTMIDLAEKRHPEWPGRGFPAAALMWVLRPANYEARRLYLDREDLLLEDAGLQRPEREGRWISNPEPDTLVGQSDPWKSVFEGMETTLEGFDFDEARGALARTALALEQHRAAHGSFPQDLAALTPESLTEVPVDPFTGSPIEYRVEKESVVLRSEGSDPEYSEGNGQFDKLLEWTLPLR